MSWLSARDPEIAIATPPLQRFCQRSVLINHHHHHCLRFYSRFNGIDPLSLARHLTTHLSDPQSLSDNTHPSRCHAQRPVSSPRRTVQIGSIANFTLGSTKAISNNIKSKGESLSEHLSSFESLRSSGRRALAYQGLQVLTMLFDFQDWAD